jgi:flagellar hook-length control protein FliK
MSTPTPATTNAPSHAAQAGTRPAHLQGQRQAPVDLFATLLALAADAAPLDAAPADPLAGDTAADARDHKNPKDPKDPKDAGGEHPLAGLLLWQPPAIDKAPTDHAATAGPAGSDTKPLPADGALATHDTPASPAADAASATPATAASAPRPAAPSWQVSAMRAAQNAPAQGTGHSVGNGNTSDAPAMRWSRGAPDAGAAVPAWSSVRSTITMDPRFPAAGPQGLALGQTGDRDTDTTPLPLGEGVRAGAPGGGPAAVAGPGGAQQGDLMGSGGEGGDTPSTHDDPSASTDPNVPTGEDTDAVEVQHWGGAHGLRHASLRVGEEAGQAIDIQLALRGDELRLDIRTDDSAAREALREQAHSALGERLQQGGLQLGDVSVGSQQQERQREGQTTLARHGSADAAAADDTPAAPRPAAREGGLDLFI